MSVMNRWCRMMELEEVLMSVVPRDWRPGWSSMIDTGMPPRHY